jgi:hypothetical protein
LFLWKVNKKQHFVVEDKLTTENIKIIQQYAPSNFHYIDQDNLEILKSNFKMDKSKNTSVIVNTEDLSFRGNQYKDIRHALNRSSKEGFSLETNYRDLSDVKKLIEEWSTNYTEQYFRDYSGKNFYFFKNNFHQGLISLFIYKENDLVAYGTLSQPKDGYSSYVIGKALYKRHYGLSEFADIELYKLGQKLGQPINHVNMGCGGGRQLLNYKTKFPHTKVIHYDGSIEV